MVTVLSEEGQTSVDGRARGNDLWLSKASLTAATGWTLKPEGLCKDDLCVPVPPSRAHELVANGDVNLAAFWRHLGRPVVHTENGSHWYLGEGAAARGDQLASLQAPDFTLPDLSGRLHSLSEHRGKKVFLATWASW